MERQEMIELIKMKKFKIKLINEPIYVAVAAAFYFSKNNNFISIINVDGLGIINIA